MCVVSAVTFAGGSLTLVIMGIFNAVKFQMKPLPLIGGFKLVKKEITFNSCSDKRGNAL